MTALLERARGRAGGEDAPPSPRRRRVPTVLQMEAVECGGASLAMILAHHGRYVPLEELRIACGISRDGSKASNIVRAARTFGLTSKGYKLEPAALRRMPLPMIVHWNFNHFLVLEGFGSRGRVFLNDPAYGPRVVSDKELDESFTGVALVMEPGPEFKPGGEGRSLVSALRRRLPRSHAALAFIVLAGLALVVPGLVVPTFSRVYVDAVLIRGLSDWVTPLLAAMGVTALFMAALTWLQQLYLLRLETKLSLTASTRFFWHVLHLPMQFLSQRFPGEIASRVGLNDRAAHVLSGELATTLLSIVVVAFYAVLMSGYDLWMTAVVVATAALNIVALVAVSRRRTDLSYRLAKDYGRSVGTTMGGLMNIETLKSTGSESDFFARWAGQYAKVVNAKQELGGQTQLLSVLPTLLMALSSTLVLGLGGQRVMDGEMSMGMLVAFQALMLAFLTPVNRLVALGSTLHEVGSDLNRLDDVLRAEVRYTHEAPDEEAHRTKLDGHLEIQRMSFGYSRLEPALIQDFNLTLKPGSRVALVGGSGSGKSTVARVVSGLYDPWAGQVLLDGLPRAGHARRTLISSLAVVDQDIFLFEGTIRENLTMWDDTVSDADLVQAARDACIHDEISARTGGYSGKVEEGGRNFSGGQRQRLEIARALVNNPTLLVLDEATSALDPITEKEIDDNLRRRGCMCLIVAHRLSTIRDCDEIVVLDRGRIVERGTHDELKARGGAYSQLIAME
ncbi:MAG TPA: NHLP family bacteriocin export ABC transporter peptidase/permease/ATPase subunit [Longimicrobium sp.]|jgi:NHLM bacteriocin system ABC transporter peptidase/ATP-binding protein